MKCINCKAELNKYDGNNGLPLFDGRVCDTCNRKVIVARLGEIYGK